MPETYRNCPPRLSSVYELLGGKNNIRIMAWKLSTLVVAVAARRTPALCRHGSPALRRLDRVQRHQHVRPEPHPAAIDAPVAVRAVPDDVQEGDARGEGGEALQYLLCVRVLGVCGVC